jgi:hypothetical protein
LKRKCEQLDNELRQTHDKTKQNELYIALIETKRQMEQVIL